MASVPTTNLVFYEVAATDVSKIETNPLLHLKIRGGRCCNFKSTVCVYLSAFRVKNVTITSTSATEYMNLHSGVKVVALSPQSKKILSSSDGSSGHSSS